MDTIQVLLYFVIGSCVVTLLTVLRTPGGPRGPYLALLVADIVLASALLTRDMLSSPLVWVAVAAYALLVPVPALLLVGSRRAAMSERLALAARLAAVRELLMPGARTRFEREQLEALARVRAGKGEDAIKALREAAAKAPDPMVRRLLGEQLVSLLVFDRRFDDALAEYDGIGGERVNPPLSPPVTAQLVRAAVETGELERAGDLLARLEQGPFAATVQAQPLLAQARMFFLAGLGRIDDVIAITTAAPPTEGAAPLADLPAVARAYWIGLAAARSGRREEALSSLGRAVELSKADRGGTALAQRRLSEVEDGSGLGPVVVPAELAQLADRIGAAARAARLPKALAGSKRPWVTLALIAMSTAAFVALEIAGGSANLENLMRAGANVPTLVSAGEWWRLPSSMFLHIGGWHIVLNMYSLWVMGRLIEERMGALRYFAVYMMAGLGGALASYINLSRRDGFGLSVGASGAIFGLLGGAIAVFWRDRTLPERVRKNVVRTLWFLAGLNVVLGMSMKQIDQAAHVGGFLTGALFGLVLAPGLRGGLARASRVMAVALALAGVGAIGWAGVNVVGSVRGEGLMTMDWGQVSFEVPRSWQVVSSSGAEALVDPDTNTALVLDRVGAATAPSASALADQLVTEVTVAPSYKSTTVSQRLVPTGDDWAQREFIVSEGSGPRRELVVVRRLGNGDYVVARVRIQREQLGNQAGVLRALLGSLRQAPPR